jgi:hypothetical protein
MKKTAIKLLITGLSLAVFAGCAGSSVGLSGGNISKTAPMLKELFPPLDAEVDAAIKIIEYDNISSADIDILKQSLKAKGFAYKDAIYSKDIIYKGMPHTATARIVFAKVLEKYGVFLSIRNINGDIDESIFDDVFGYVSGKFSQTEIIKSYDKNAVHSLNAYGLKLIDEYEFEEDYGVILVKNDGNFLYLWGGVDFSNNVMVTWNIEALPQ